MPILSKRPAGRGATRTTANRAMAKRQGNLSNAFAEGNRKYVAYGVACLMCVGAGAYIGHSSQQQVLDEQQAGNPTITLDQDSNSSAAPPLQIKYAYFGAPAIQMPSEKQGIQTPNTDALQPEDSDGSTQRVAMTSNLEAAHPPIIDTDNAKPSTVEAILAESGSDNVRPDETNIATVAKGDSFSTIGQGFGLSVRETANIMQDELASKHLNTIIPGEQISFEHNADGEVEQIVYVIDDTRTLVLDRADNARFTASLDEVALEKRIMVNMGVVKNSLFLSAAEAGVSNRHIMQMVEIFRWDIDFAMDVQPNDSFKIVYEGYFKGDQLVRTGRLLGVEFKGRSTHQALYFEDSNGEGAYYTARGRQLEKQFLRNPVDTVRITSPFNLHRKHPVLNTIKAHKGVDYGAPIGTPIKATADGVVKQSGRRGTYGLTVELQHGKKYTTLYAHMNKIHANTTVGKKVKQGQVIGYVGKTGRVTGAHLHYEFRVKGVHVNPQTVKFAGAGSIPEDQLQQFKTATAPIMQQLTALRPSRIALSQ